jgi:multimeric flavodoxin WrbA
MRILGINGSPRGQRSLTRALVAAVLEGAQAEGAEVELVDVSTLQIQGCGGCGVCYRTGACVLHDDFPALYARMLDSEGLVFGSPNYFHSVSAQLKLVIDRMSDGVHCHVFHGKYACAVGVAGSPEFHQVTDYLSQLLLMFGATVVGTTGASARDETVMTQANAEAVALGKSLVDAIHCGFTSPEQEAVHRQIRDYFRAIVVANQEIWPHEYQHYQRMGWL